jgi:hypothetical protein
MKKSIILVLTYTVLIANLCAQITINKSHMSASGQMNIQAYDYTGYPIPGNGANFNWDFSNLIEDERDSLYYGLPQWYPGANAFPTANLVSMYNGVDSSYDFLNLNDNDLSFLGTVDYTDGKKTVSAYNMKFITFPSTFNTAYADATTLPGQANELGIDPDGPGPLPFIDSIYFELGISNKSIIDGYGSIKIPMGTYPTIRQKMTTISDLKNIKMYVNNTWTAVPKILLGALGFGNTADTSYRIAFWTNDNTLGRPLLEYDYSNGDTSISDITYLVAKGKTSGIFAESVNNTLSIFPNPFQNNFQVQFKNAAVGVLMIIDQQGRTIEQLETKNGDTIDLSKYEAGVYLVQIRDVQTGRILGTQKVTKL